MTLTDMTCKAAKPAENGGKPYKLYDSGGLFLLVKPKGQKTPSGAKIWRLKYYYLGQENLMSLGAYPLISLSEAREGRDRAKKLLAMTPPQDPVQHRENSVRLAVRNAENTFEVVARDWHDKKKDNWSEGYAQKIMRCFEINVFPIIGTRPIAEIKPSDLIDCLRKVEARGALDILGKTKQVCGMVFRYGIQTGKCDIDPTSGLKGAFKTRRTKHFSAIDGKEIPDFIKALDHNEARLFARTRRAIIFSMHTFQRPGEIRQAQWSEIDFEAREWRIPARKMKMGRDHIVPLSKQMLALLKEQKEETGHLNTDWIFPSQVRPRQPMSDGTVNRAIKNLGYGQAMVAHGFRALARTTIREQLDFNSEVIELQLAHLTSNPLGEAYDRVKFLEQRRKMMQAWSDYLDAVSCQKVIAGNFKKRA